jgi:hypothetical protein
MEPSGAIRGRAIGARPQRLPRTPQSHTTLISDQMESASLSGTHFRYFRLLNYYMVAELDPRAFEQAAAPEKGSRSLATVEAFR